MSEELEARVAQLLGRVEALEARCEQLERVAHGAFGEASFAGQLAPLLLAFMRAHGLINEDALREALDHYLRRCEEAEGSFPGSAASLAHARSRVEATLRSLPQPPPEPRSANRP